MATQVLTDVKLWVAHFDLSGDHNAVTLSFEAEALDDTVFGDDTRSNQGGLKAVSYEAEGFWSGGTDNVDEVLFSRIGTANVLHSLSPNGETEGDPAYFFRAMEGSYSPGASVGELLAFSHSAQGSGGNSLIRGNILHSGAESSTGDATAQNLGAVAAGEKLYAGLHVLSASGTSPTLDVTIESDAANDFTGSETTRITFSQVDDTLGSEWATPVSGAITDTWWRATYTLGGTTPSFTFIVVLGIQ